jgi:hypothetical protein
MFNAAETKLRKAKDLRLFFTLSHGYITKKIYKHIDLFNNPNSLMKLNDSFATAFLAAINGNPSGQWFSAFRICKSLEDNAVNAKGLVATLVMARYSASALESCASCMAKVHISQDLKKALNEVQDVDIEDYGNILIFVTEGHLYAEAQCRGVSLGAVFFMFSVPLMEWLNTNAKKWRNDAFEAVYHKKVPDPSQKFTNSYRKAEGR